MPPSCRFLSVHLAPVQVSARISGALFPNGNSPIVLSKFPATWAPILAPADLQSPPHSLAPTQISKDALCSSSAPTPNLVLRPDLRLGHDLISLIVQKIDASISTISIGHICTGNAFIPPYPRPMSKGFPWRYPWLTPHR